MNDLGREGEHIFSSYFIAMSSLWTVHVEVPITRNNMNSDVRPWSDIILTSSCRGDCCLTTTVVEELIISVCKVLVSETVEKVVEAAL